MNDHMRNQILLKLIHSPEARFSDIWDKKIESNVFTYHLKKLETEGLVEKKDELYSLTDKGRQESAFIEGTTGDKAMMVVPVVVIIVIDEKKVLVQRRLKEPFYGYHGFISGKINFGFNAVECAARDLLEETDLSADLELKGISMTKTFNDGKLAFHHFFFTVLGKNHRGKLKYETHKEENFWVSLDDTSKLENKFPDFDYVLDLVQGDKFFIREVDRIQENSVFKESVVRSERFL